MIKNKRKNIHVFKNKLFNNTTRVIVIHCVVGSEPEIGGYLAFLNNSVYTSVLQNLTL